MEKSKLKNIPIGVGFYIREEWERFLASASDREKLEDTYDEWLCNLYKGVRQMRAMGINPKKVVVHLDELINYCIDHKLKNDSEGRTKFITDLVLKGRNEEIDLSNISKDGQQ